MSPPCSLQQRRHLPLAPLPIAGPCARHPKNNLQIAIETLRIKAYSAIAGLGLTSEMGHGRMSRTHCPLVRSAFESGHAPLGLASGERLGERYTDCMTQTE